MFYTAKYSAGIVLTSPSANAQHFWNFSSECNILNGQRNRPERRTEFSSFRKDA